MVTTLILLFPVLTVCWATSITEEQLRSVIEPMLDANQSPIAPADSPPLVESLSAASPLAALVQSPNITADSLPFVASLSSGSTLDAPVQSPTAPVDPPPLFAALAKVSPLQSPNFERPHYGGSNQMASQVAASNQMSQLKLANGLVSMITNAISSFKPQPPTPVDPLLGGMFPNGGFVQPAPAPVQPQRRMNMFNPLSFLFPGSGGGNPFGMMMPGLLMGGLFELF